MKDTVLIGLGNTLFSDEGIGMHVVHRLLESGDLPQNIDCIEMGTGGMRIIHAIAGRRKAVFVDCARMGKAPGTMKRFVPGGARSRKKLPGFSLHEGDLLSILEVARQAVDCPEEIVIFGIEPGSVAPGENLSRELADRLAEYSTAIMAELKRAPKKSRKNGHSRAQAK